MVGLVLVSHSRDLANALLDFLRQVTPPGAPVVVAAGVGDERQEFGTDAVEIGEAIQSVYSEDGVLILMDLGSAVLSAQLAVDLLPPEIASRVRFCAAPFVEGALAAAVQVGLSSDIDTICREARGALLPKQEQLGEASAVPPSPMAATTTPTHTLRLTLTNLHGLHARPAAQFVQTAGSFNADVQVTNRTTGKGPVSARSLNAIATLGAVEHHEIEIRASGPEAEPALAALQKLVAANFGEPAAHPSSAKTDLVTKNGIKTPPLSNAGSALERGPGGEVAPSPAAPRPGGEIAAIPISEGIALGPLFRYQPPPPPVSTEPARDPAAEWQHLQLALSSVREAIHQRRRQLQSVAGPAEAAIFDAHLLILDDPDLLDKVQTAIQTGHRNAAEAWYTVMNGVAGEYRALTDPYLQARAADVQDVRDQVLFALAGPAARSAGAAINLDHPVILFAQDLTPSETSQLDMGRVLGIITAGGGPTSHSAILARALGIPAVSGAGPLLEQIEPGATVALDGATGAVWLKPSTTLLAELAQRRDEWLALRKKLLDTSQSIARTRDGRRIEVFANIGSPLDARLAVDNGAEGVGLLRTEFLFLTRQTPPTEADQLAAFREIGAAMGGRPVTARTLDVGGDKEVPYIHLPAEANPFLGVRALRLSLHNPEDLFLPQLRAILRAAADYPYRIMFPMVANVDEVRQARGWLEKAHAALEAEKLPHAWPIEAGIMVEIPSAALLAPALAKEVDFFSIGTNDLTQYTLAAERGNPMLAGFADALHPAVLRLIGEVARAARGEGKWTGVCGELAGDPQAASILVGLGVDELSLSSAGIPRIKSILRSVDLPAAQELAARALQAESAPAVRNLAQEFLASL